MQGHSGSLASGSGCTKRQPPPQKKNDIQMMGYTRDSFLIKRLIQFQSCLSSREAEGLSVMSTGSILFNGHYESNVYIFISSLGPSDAYSSTLSSLNFNL